MSPAELRADHVAALTRAGITPDPWQARVLRTLPDRLLLCCARQAGKSTVGAALALLVALLTPGALVLLLSPTLRQSGELFREKVLRIWNRLGRPEFTRAATRLELELRNGSRVVSLPESEEGIRGFSSVSLLLIDEASRVADDVYAAVCPMLSVSRGKLVAMSTPFYQRGWFYKDWEKGEGWDRVRVTARECPRHTPEFLAEERRKHGEAWCRQEYECSFEPGGGSPFNPGDIATDPSLTPLALE